MNGGNQNSQQGGEKKAQLSWSQPITQTPVNQKQPSPQKESPKTPTVSQSVAKTSNVFRNTVITIVVLAAVGAVWAIVVSSKHSRTSTVIQTATNSGTQAPASTSTQAGNTSTTADGSLSIPTPQDAGLQVAVSNIQVSVPTWVVIYENYNGQPGNVLGAGLFVSGRSSGVVDLLRGTLPGQTYFAGESRDDGDHMYSIQNDPAVRDANGNPVWIKFQTR